MKDDGQRKSEIFLGYLYHELDGDQKMVLEHMYGMHGATRFDTDAAIAQEAKMDPARVTKIRSQIAEKIRSHIEQV
jgi:DNA-directed RNA polymerase sigma subunit (sigma70/sigma32)